MNDGLPRRVVLVGANYWPEGTGSAPYTTGLAEDLAAHGVEVTVLAGMPHYPQWRVWKGYRNRARVREWRNGVEIVHAWLWVPRHQSALRRALWEATFLSSVLGIGGVRRPDVVLASTPSLSGAVAARVLARRWRVPYGLVVQDLVGPGARQSGIGGGAGVAPIVEALEGWAMRGASGVAVVSQGFRGYLEGIGVDRAKIDHLRNWAQHAEPTRERAETRASLGWREEDTVVLYAGSMGLKQGLEQVIETARLAQATAPALRFALAGDGSQRAALHASASGLTNLTFLLPLKSGDHADLLAAADILVISERPGMVDMSLPSKLTSYAAAGRPIVAAVPPGGATAAEVAASGAGLVTAAGDAAALVDVFRDLAADPERRGQLAEAGAAYARDVVGSEACLADYRDFVRGLSARTGGDLEPLPATPLVSVVTPSYNAGPYLARCLASVRDQTYPAIEHLVQDAGSTDETVQVLADFEGTYDLHVAIEPDAGQADALNRGFARARGEIVCWLNADDEWLGPEVVAEAVAALRDHDLVAAGGWYVDAQGRRLRRIEVDPDLALPGMSTYSTLLQPATFWRRSVHTRLREDLHYAFDWRFFLDLRDRCRAPLVVEREWAAYRWHGGSKTADDPALRRREIADILRAERGFWGPHHLWARAISGSYRLAETTPVTFPRWLVQTVNVWIRERMGLGHSDRRTDEPGA